MAKTNSPSEAIQTHRVWSVAGLGRHQPAMGTHAIVTGDHTRARLENNWYYETLGREGATPTQAREILGISR
ncbi:3-keto-5-aminohexanoate cleavage protein [Rhodococcus erythropolis]